MRLDPKIIQSVKDMQARVFRLAKAADPLLTMKAISADSGIDYDSLCNYAKGATQMPVAALYALVDVIPDELLSLLLPEGRAIIRIPESIDHDHLAEAFADFLACKNAAHHPESEAGRDIGPNERERLDAKVVMLPIVRAA